MLLELNVNAESKIHASFKNIHCALKYAVIHLPSFYLNVNSKASRI